MKADWANVPLGEILTERRETPSIDAILAGEIPIVSKIVFDSGQIELRDNPDTRTGMILIRPGDLVLSGINAAKGAIAIYDEKNEGPAAATIHYAAYIPNEDKVNVRYLWWFLRSREFRRILNHYLPGGIKTELKATRLLPILVPLPSIPEQEAILETIEMIDARVAEARYLRQEAINKVEALGGSIFTTTLKDLPCDGCLAEVMDGKPRNGWSVKCDNSETGTPVLTLSAVTGFKYSNSEFKTTSEITSPEAHYWLQEGDFLITRSNTPDLVGHVAIYNGSPSPCIYPDLIMKIKFTKDRVSPDFVVYWLQTRFVREYIKANAKGTSGTMKKINQNVVMNTPFPTALNLKEQLRFVSYFDNLQERLDSLEQLQQKTVTELDALLPSILDKAFKGEL